MIKKKSLYSYMKSKTNKYKHGGQFNAFLDDYNQYNTGGTHENNPHGGIPLGMGNNGLPNTVEQNESSFDFEDGKYIFSDRLGFDMESNMKTVSNDNKYGGKLKGIMDYKKLNK